MRLASIGALWLDLVVVHQIAITRAKLTVLRKVVDRRAEAIGAMFAGRAAQLPQRLLESAAHRLERFGKTDRDRLPIRIGQREVIQQMVEWLAADADSQRVHAGKVRRPQSAWVMHLGKHHRLVGTMPSSPIAYASLERPPLGIEKPTRILILKPAEKREGPQPWFVFKPLFDLRPNLAERIGSGSPIAWGFSLRGERFGIAILSCCLLIHARLPCRQC